MKLDEKDYLVHYGILRKSGRYPWGSGNNPKQRSKTFLDITEDLKKQGMTESQIAKSFSTKEHPFTTADLRALRSISVNMQKQEQIRTAQRLADKGMGASAIARQMSTPEKPVSESTVRSLLAPGRQEKADVLRATADMLKRQVDEKGFVDVGAHVERDLPIGDNPNVRVGISADKFKTALAMLKEEGYEVHPVRIRQVGTGEYTRNLVLAKPGTTQKDVFLNRDKIQQISESSRDGGKNYEGLQPPLNISSKRVAVRYKEDGGADADGVIYVRPGVKDVSLGNSRYAQVRIGVDGTHYLKGMAIYKHDLPPGVDLMFNTNKSNTGNKLDAMKPQKTDDPLNPFGAALTPRGQIKGSDGKVSSVMNKLSEEGDWQDWSRSLSRQVLSKQSPDLAKSQLGLTYDRRRAELDEIMALTNPTIKKKLLETFGDETDSASVHLKAAAMPKQATKVLLPVSSLKPTEIFAPGFKDGERVALIRFPHAGTFEIPEVTVNNRNREARKLFGIGEGGSARDAVGIHPKVAERLSGADFDGDTVVVIPNNRGTLKSTPALEKLKGFDPQTYKVPKGPPTKEHPDGKPIISGPRKQQEMGNVTNLISDMTIRGANSDELARAVRHSMVVIDSEKHNLDYKASARDNGILELKRKYQGVTETGQLKGASTLITRATAQVHVPRRKARPAAEGGPIDPATGRKVYVETGERRKDGSVATFRSKKLAETDDAYTLVSGARGTPIEQVYADHSNRLKALANTARKESLSVKPIPYSPSAKKVYGKEVESLNSKLDIALRNAPLERQAQRVANAYIAQRRRDNPDMDKDQLKKLKSQALDEARIRTGAKKKRIEITPREWEAIQAGAISNHKLEQILNNTDTDQVRKLATPRQNPVMTPAVTNRAKAYISRGYTLAEVAEFLNVPVSTLQSGIADGE